MGLPSEAGALTDCHAGSDCLWAALAAKLTRSEVRVTLSPVPTRLSNNPLLLRCTSPKGAHRDVSRRRSN
jgi:hypothetical protein